MTRNQSAKYCLRKVREFLRVRMNKANGSLSMAIDSDQDEEWESRVMAATEYQRAIREVSDYVYQAYEELKNGTND